MRNRSLKDSKIAIVGLGYVGLPLAVEFAKNNFQVLGFDIDQNRIKDLNNGRDITDEVEEIDLKNLKNISYSNDESTLRECTVFIITVPTPIDRFKQPDLKPLLSASRTVGRYLKKNDVVIYESTVYPGCTEEDCVPVLEEVSGLKFNEDFFCGYSPERINPGDKVNRVHNIVKVTSGSTPETAELVNELYSSIVKAGTHKASSIKIAEASKIIENTQRDLNISLVNELALIFDKLRIDTVEVLEAAGTKWNFLPFRPGLVGGHCIGVDPYYLTHKAESVGYHPQVILSGRRINDNMGIFVANNVIKLMVKHELKVKRSRVLVLGITFKENCPDIRNSRVIDMIQELEGFGVTVDVYDKHASPVEVKREYGIELLKNLNQTYDAIVMAVGHEEFRELNIEDLKRNPTSVVYDIKSFFPKDKVTARL
ncbi:nucleotide sugar dehydrogenase [Robertkochia aurantiaca]|uniref:nucleotide sugar dehydrogenase n=1 Tax=Robertkochia aurantiaca TaxID=2873700 RepID=UPI001CCA3A72|nr:nucleotide sugar dehydrogenase [Robertkochia sp. 3YJGBD-33]